MLNSDQETEFLSVPHSHEITYNVTHVITNRRRTGNSYKTALIPGNVKVSALYEPPHDKTNQVTVRPAKTLISLGIGLVW